MKISKPTHESHHTAVQELFSELEELIELHAQREDDRTPVYQWQQQISSIISKAQSGKGPMRDRYIEIAELAIAAVLSLDRNEAKS